jgi:hypothetical protein
MPHYSNKVAYDPVPPYDAEDIESGSRVPDLEAENTTTSEGDIQLQTGPESNVAVPDHQQSGRLTQRECCAYAFRYFACSLVALVLMIWIIAFYSYKGKKIGH